MSETADTDVDTDAAEQDEKVIIRPAPTKVYDLARSIQTKDGKDLTSLTLREPTVGEVAIAERELAEKVDLRTGRKYQFKLISLVSGVEVEELAALPSSVFVGAARYLQDWVELYAGKFRPEIEDPSMLSEGGFLINLEQPITADGKNEISQLMLTEPTIAQLEKAETWLKNYTAENRRNFDMALIMVGYDGPQSTRLIRHLPVSVANKAAAFMRGFTQPVPVTGRT